MKLDRYPKIGSTVSYIRQQNDGLIVRGNACVYGFALDPDKRPMAHLCDATGAKFNVHLSCLAPTEEFCQLFTDTMAKIKATGAEGNSEVAALVSEWNEKVAVLQALILGDCIVTDA